VVTDADQGLAAVERLVGAEPQLANRTGVCDWSPAQGSHIKPPLGRGENTGVRRPARKEKVVSDTSWFVVDIGGHDKQREELVLDAGWWPDLTGEAEATMLLYTDLDIGQQATLNMLHQAGVL
jgi:hypothetical protein